MADDSRTDVTFRRYDERDADAVWALHEWAMAAAGPDPADIPGTDDLRRIESAYLEAGGEFLVGVDTEVGEAPADGDTADDDPRPLPRTVDGALVAMGGVVPSEAGQDDERSVPGAGELHRMRVAPPRQREGLGRHLLELLEARARESGFDRLLATTSTMQAAAVAFYSARGYREVDRSTVGDYRLVHFEKRLDRN